MPKFRRLIQKPWIGRLLFTVMQSAVGSLRLKVQTHPEYDQNQAYLFAFWHGKQFLPIWQLKRHLTPKAALVSPSHDGDILQACLERCDYEVVRGSSRDNNVRSLIQMVRLLKKGFSVGFGVDGPVGPIYQVKPGLTFMAQKCQIPIVPLGSAFNRQWIFEKAWDKFALPKPFGKAGYYIGKPIFIPKDADLNHYNEIVEAELNHAQQQATKLLTGAGKFK